MKAVILASIFAVLMMAGPAALAQDESRDADPIVATVDGHEIHQSDVAVAYDRLPDRFKQVPFNVLFPQLVNQLVVNRLLEIAGRELNLHDDETLKTQLKDAEAALIQQAYLERKIAEAVTEDAIVRVYEETIGNAEGPEEVRASHILVDTEEEGTALIEELAGGADFAALAREHSTGPSGPRGGDLGYFTRDAMVEPFAEAAFSLEVGAVGPDPVKTQFGWHVIKVLDKRRQPPADLEESRAQIQDLLTREFVTAHMSELKANAEIETFNLDGSPTGEAPAQ